MNFYIYSNVWGNNILYRGYKNGKAITEKVPFKPTLYVPSKTGGEYKSLYDNTTLKSIPFDSIRDAKDFVEKYKGVEGFDVHGFTKWQYQYLHDEFPDDIEYDLSQVSILTFDLEVIDETGTYVGFPSINKADVPIVLISMHNSKDHKTYVLGLKDYTPFPDDNFKYIKFSTEKDLLKYFISYCVTHKVDIWTGWNTDSFDIPYLCNRIVKLFSEDMLKKLSPFGIIRPIEINNRGETINGFDILGLVSLDYLNLYKKFGTYSAKESYALGAIAEDVLGITKVEMPASTFLENYRDHFNIFVKYNARDTELVEKMDAKLKLIELTFSLAYLYKTNLQDVFRTVLPWEVYIYNHLSKKKIAFPPRRSGMTGEVEGAWVKNPVPGMYGWCMSFDFASLYPSIMRQWNISPETLVDADIAANAIQFLEKRAITNDLKQRAKDENLSLAANGAFFRKDSQGFLPELMEIVMSGRSSAKKKMLKLEQEYQSTKDAKLIPQISSLHNRQMALKIAANSCYGACGNSGFHFYDSRIAEAITLTGQLSDMHMANALNVYMNKTLGTDKDYVIAGDTDSVYLDCEDLVQKYCTGASRGSIVKFLNEFAETKLQKVINKSISTVFDEMNAYKTVMACKREAIASKALFRAKKNYAMYVHNSEGVDYNPPKLKVMGIEIIRASTPKWCRNELKSLLTMMFETSEAEFQKQYKVKRAEFYSLDPELIAFPRGANDIDKYRDNSVIYKKGAPAHVRGALLYNHYYAGNSPLQNGDKLKFVYLKLPNPIRENIISFPTECPKELKKYVDMDTQFEKAFKSPLESLTNCAKWELEKKSTVMSLFD